MLYSDHLIAVSNWPSISTQYLFDLVGNQSQIQIDFLFDPSHYTVFPKLTEASAIKNAQDACCKNARIASVTYSNIFYQLNQPDVKINFHSSIDRSHDQPQGSEFSLDKEKLSAYAHKIHTYLRAIIARGSDAT